jgi:hypothetical protein
VKPGKVQAKIAETAPGGKTEPVPARPAIKQAINPAKVLQPDSQPVKSQIVKPAYTVGKAAVEKIITVKPLLEPLKILMVVWGTPNDEGLASPSQTRDYSVNLAKLMTDIIKKTHSRPVDGKYSYITDRNHHRLMRDKPEYRNSRGLCEKADVDLLLIGFMEGAEFSDNMGFDPTRRPFFSVFNCKSGKGKAKRFEVSKALKEVFPYEKDLARVFLAFTQNELEAIGY